MRESLSCLFERKIEAGDDKFSDGTGILIDFVTSWRKEQHVPTLALPTRYQITPNCGP